MPYNPPFAPSFKLFVPLMVNPLTSLELLIQAAILPAAARGVREPVGKSVTA